MPATTAAPTEATSGSPPPCTATQAATGNPFADHPDWYVNPTYVRNLERTIGAASDPQTVVNLQRMLPVPSAFWLDVKRKAQMSEANKRDVGTAHGILEDARAKGGKHVTFIVYDLPNRDCHAKASNGEICCKYNSDGTCDYLGADDACADGLHEYRSTYIDPLVELFAAYPDVPLTLVIEPDSLPNMVTNTDDPRCGNLASRTAYLGGVSYAVSEFAEKTHAVQYLDGGHGGWLGWENNAGGFAELIAEAGVASQIRGFATNVAGYQPLGTVACPAEVSQGSDAILKYCSLTVSQRGGKGTACCADSCGLADEWNSAVSEINYVAVLHRVMSKAIPGFDPKFVVDTGRNGVPGARAECSNWCNARGAGVGRLPAAHGLPDPRIDAVFWLKTPGESDGCTKTLPDGGQCPRFDSDCASPDSLGSAVGEPRSPEAGHWFTHQIEQLAANAAFGPEPPPAPSPCDAVTQPGSTTTHTSAVPATDTPSDTTPGGCVPQWQQCGGRDFVGSSECCDGTVCVKSNEWYSQCR